MTSRDPISEIKIKELGRWTVDKDKMHECGLEFTPPGPR